MKPLFLIPLLLVSCVPDKPPPDAFTRGQIVTVKMSGERGIVLGRTNRWLMYEEKYDVRNQAGVTLELYPFELEPTKP
jgi:hypothetical protein